MLHSFNKGILFIPMKIKNQLCHAGIKQFTSAEFTNICSYHHGIPPFDTGHYFHDPGNLSGLGSDTVVKQIDTIGTFIVIASSPVTGNG